MIVGVMMVKDEIDILPWTLGRMAAQGVERFVIADNGSTDGTREMLDAYSSTWAPVTVIDDAEPAFNQSAKMTALVHRFCLDGDWVIPFDADELWTGAHGGTLAGALGAAGAPIVRARVRDYLPHATDPQNERDPYLRTSWRELADEPLPVVAFRYHWQAVLAMGNHDVARPGERANGLRVRHLQYRSLEQFSRKVRNGRTAIEAATDDRTSCAHWRTFGALDDHDLKIAWKRLTSQSLEFDPL